MKWTKCSEKMPEATERILFLSVPEGYFLDGKRGYRYHRYIHHIGYFVDKNKCTDPHFYVDTFFANNNPNDEETKFALNSVRYWMPLPELPTD